MSFVTRRLEWPFPQSTAHDGIPLGNGLLGVLLCGGGGRLRIILNRADYWDHRGGKELAAAGTYDTLLRLLAAGEQEKATQSLTVPAAAGHPPAPTRLPVGAFELPLASDQEPIRGGLWLNDGRAQVDVSAGTIDAIVVREAPVLAMRLPGTMPIAPVPRPAEAQDIREFFAKYGYGPPRVFREGNLSGWVQPRPEDKPVLCAAALVQDREIYFATVYGADERRAIQEAGDLLRRYAAEGFERLKARDQAWWASFWERTPQIHIPDPDLELFYYLGMYKVGAMMGPQAVPAGLQGPWIEDHRMPPWQADYHFNINVQECYWPAYAGNHGEWLLPLFEMIWSWRPRLQANARHFLGIDDGLMLLHATDDRGQRIYASWLAAADFGCTAWMALMMWQYYRYTRDAAFLKDRAYPFMKGALRVYEAMLQDDGTRYHLPLGVSPEFYFGAKWGANASFQLANIHALCRAAAEASIQLNTDESCRARWSDIDRRLPLASTADCGQGEEILIWDGQPLDQSHRHHSHLAGIYPFDIYRYGPSEPDRNLVETSMARLVRMGMGAWSGWAMPWASILWSRMENGPMAEFCLHVLRRFFVRPGYATTHDAIHSGFTTMSARREIMQLDAAMGAAAAVMDMLVHSRNGTLHLFPAIPESWADLSFAGIRTEGAFRVSAERTDGSTCRVEIASEAGGTLTLANPFGSRPARLTRGREASLLKGELLTIHTTPGERVQLSPDR